MTKSENICVPIKAIIDQFLTKNDADYSDETIMALRYYSIALLNLHFIRIDDIESAICKITSGIKRVIYRDSPLYNKLDHYRIVDEILYIESEAASPDTIEYDITLFKAFTQALINSDDKRIGISNAICEMIAERVWRYKLKEETVIKPCAQQEIINGISMRTYSGYRNYDVIINLLLMYFFALGINCDNVFRRMMEPNGSFNIVLDDIVDSFSEFDLLQQLDRIALSEIRRKGINEEDPDEAMLIRSYQKDVFYTIICERKNRRIRYNSFIALVMEKELQDFFLNIKPLEDE